jgi:hypothetical protein
MADLTILDNRFSGTFRGTNNIIEAEIRMDPLLNTISGDLYYLHRDRNGITRPFYMYSFISVDIVAEQTDIIKISGKLEFFRYTALEGQIDIEIRDNHVIVELSFRNRLTNPKSSKAVFQLQKVSSFFRELELEIDQMQGARSLPIFNSHDLINRPIDLPNENISLKLLFAKAGINIIESPNSNIIPVNPTSLWSVRELHAIMENNMSDFETFNGPQWRLYLLIATLFEDPGTLGIIYDTNDEVPRQGSAVFTKHPLIDGDTSEYKREYLFTAVHELGHTFNLFHSFQKGLSGPFEFPRPDSISFMNYPHLFPEGGNAPSNHDGRNRFWSQFMYNFDNGDLLHIRHHDLFEVIMGGQSFGDESHYKDKIWSGFTKVQNSLELKIRSVKKVFEFGEPILVETKLQNKSTQSQNVPSSLNIKDGFTNITIKGPDGKLISYKPMITRCFIDETIELPPNESKYEDLYIFYGKDGFYFKEPGLYKIQSIIPSLDGILKSNVHEIVVAEPQSIKESKKINEIFTRENGQYLYLKGSDFLSSAEKELTTLENDLTDINLARHIEFCKGEKLSDEFKSIGHNKVNIREPKLQEAKKNLELSVSKTRTDEIAFGNIMLNRVMTKISYIEEIEGEITRAKDTISELISYMKKRHVTKKVIDNLEEKHDTLKKK